jgi:HAD superfamily hydrolase (TIGR01459 family)
MRSFILPHGIASISNRYEAFLLDQWGCLHDGERALPGAVEAVEQLHSEGKLLAILSNTSKRSVYTLARLSQFGFNPSHFRCGITSGEEAVQHFARNHLKGSRALILGWTDETDPDGFMQAMGVRSTCVETADLILCHGPDTIVRPEGTGPSQATNFRYTGDLSPYEAILKRGSERGLTLYNCNPDMRVNSPSGELWWMPGVISKYYQELGGRVEWFGKPYKSHFESAVRLLGVPKSKVIHVGDSLEHDIAGANAAGIDSLFCAAGGVHGQELSFPSKIEEDMLGTLKLERRALDAIEDKYLAYPTYSLPLLCWKQ